MKKAKLKNNRKKFNILKLIMFSIIVSISIYFTVDYLIENNKNFTKEEYVNYLMNKSLNKNTNNFIVKESIKLLSKVDITSPNSKEKKIKKDNTASEDDYSTEMYSNETSYIENDNKNNIDPIIYIYNSHQLETYSNIGFENSNISPNVMMVSYLLKDSLKKEKISAVVEDTNIAEFIKISNLKSDSFYASTRIFIKNAINKHNTLKYFIDIHRDSVAKNITTCNINNKNYARILFVLGVTNPNYKENEKLMKSLDSISDKLYPGLSRGIYNRPTPNWPDAYNQDLNSGVILIEVGGKENTMDEVENTVSALSNIIKEYIKGE